MKVDVIIPVYGPGNRLLELFDRLGRQTVPVDRLIIMNTRKVTCGISGRRPWNREDSRKISPCTM